MIITTIQSKIYNRIVQIVKNMNKKTVPISSTIAITCRDCHGSGYITDSRYPWRTNICSECDGRGWYTVEIKKSHTLRNKCE